MVPFLIFWHRGAGRQDAGAQPGYTMMIARDEAAYAWDAIRHIGAAHGLIPVGPAAVAPGGAR